MFRDQSQKVMAKVLAGSGEGQPSQPLLRSSPKLAEDETLVTFFANNFTCKDSAELRSNLFWIPSHFDDILKTECTKYSVQCAGAMALARLKRSAYYLREAQKKYGLAMMSLSKVWQRDGEADNDGIVFAVFFLGFYEILAAYDGSCRQLWATHLNGLGSLLRKRGQTSVPNDFGMRMLLQSRSQMILNSLQTMTAIPEPFAKPSQEVRDSIPLHFRPSDDADMLLIHLADFQARYKSTGASQMLIDELTSLDQNFQQWADDLPPDWSFSPHPSTNKSEFWWEARHDVYPSLVKSHVWNKTRAARIVIFGLLEEMNVSLSRLDPYNFEPVAPTNPPLVIEGLILDICATIPICYRPTVEHSEGESLPSLGATYWLFWPLEVMGHLKNGPPGLAEWVHQCLLRVHEITGNMTAQLLANRVMAVHKSHSVA